MGRFINADGYASTGQGITGNNMFVYCGNNPVLYEDAAGNRYCAATSVKDESAYDRFISCSHQTELLREKNAPATNATLSKTPEQIVIEADFITFYKGVPVIKVPIMGNSAFSFGVIFMGSKVSDPNLVRHEYGHIEQLRELGVWKYATYIVVPSVIFFNLTQNGELPLNLYYSWPWEYKANELGNANGVYSTWAKSVSDLYWELLTTYS